MEKSDQSRSDHGQCMHAHQAWFTDWAQALSILLTTSSCSPAADSAQQTCGWIWKVLSVSVYLLFQTLGILTFIIQSPFIASIRKDKFIYTDFIFKKEIRHHYSVHMKQRQRWRRPSPVSAETGQWIRENTGQGGEGARWAGVTSLPNFSCYANRSTDTFRCSCRKRCPVI